MDAAPPLDVALARRVGSALVPMGPSRTPSKAAAVVAGLREAAAASVAHVASVTGLAAVPGEALVVDRAGWVAANAELAGALLAGAAVLHPDSRAAGRWGRARARAEALGNAAQLGAVLAWLSGRVLGQYLPFGPPRLLLVAPNVARLEAELGVVPEDFRLWVCLHEQTHRLQFAAAPWLRDHLVADFAAVLSTEAGPADGGRRRAASPLELLVGPGQRAVLDRITAAMSLLEGYADVMMDRVGPDVVPSVAAIRGRFEARRDAGGAVQVLGRLLGLELKLAQYRDGAAFCRAVIDAVGVAGLNAVYSGPEALPTLDEIHDPVRWVARTRAVAAS